MEGGAPECPAAFRELFRAFKKPPREWPAGLRASIVDPQTAGLPRASAPSATVGAASASSSTPATADTGLRPAGEWEVLEVPGHPGLLVLPQALSRRGQIRWARRCLVDFPSATNVCCVEGKDATPAAVHPNGRSLWQVHAEAAAPQHCCLARPQGAGGGRSDDQDGQDSADSKLKSRPAAKRLRQAPPEDHQPRADTAGAAAGGAGPPAEAQTAPPACRLDRLRWVTLGFHYDWSTKTYSAARHSDFPQDLVELVRTVAAAALPGEEVAADTAIVNFYRGDKHTLAPHVDHSELDHSVPLVAVSLGLDGLFLINKPPPHAADPPTPLLLRSGTVVVMGGASRLCHHAVPKVLSGTLPDWWLAESEAAAAEDPASALEMRELAHFMQNTRINISARRVMPREETL